RFIDTAGIRYTDDTLEAMGIERTFRRMENASVILFVAEATDTATEILSQLRGIDWQPRQHTAIVLNKMDRDASWATLAEELTAASGLPVIALSARSGENLDKLIDYLCGVAGKAPGSTEVIVTNARHYEALNEAHAAIRRAKQALASELSTDLLAEEIRAVIASVGSITGDTPTTSDLLQTIFSRFCIGK
ncbi:MAG: tRNA uridine-5-carboxymethylaminomethyl(34) synthesis GTPase MnmE, partial [Rikenellaceae bacterium]|nr:tRNA uridine-5-carboxymethylaminomethyl(34) synthesis GTPase MnmE [Rikenellaceae bacterium]